MSRQPQQTECRGFHRQDTHGTDSSVLRATRYADWLLIDKLKDYKPEMKSGTGFSSHDLSFPTVMRNCLGERVGNFHIDNLYDIVESLGRLRHKDEAYNILFDELRRCENERYEYACKIRRMQDEFDLMKGQWEQSQQFLQSAENALIEKDAQLAKFKKKKAVKRKKTVVKRTVAPKTKK